MGTISAPCYANITMGEIDEKLKTLASSLRASDPLSLYKRFIDAIFAIWTDTVEKLKRFLHLINSLHPTLKFTPVPIHATFPHQPNMTVFVTLAGQYHF